MSTRKLTKDQYRDAIIKLSPASQKLLIRIYYYYPVSNMAEMANKMGVKGVGGVNLSIGKLSKELYFHTNYIHPERNWVPIVSPYFNARFSLVHFEAHGGLSSSKDYYGQFLSESQKEEYFRLGKVFWLMIPELSLALEELSLVSPRRL